MNIFENFSTLFVEVWKKGILGIDIFQILIGLGIFLLFLLFRGLISKFIINRLKKIAKNTTNKLDDSFVEAMEGPARFFPIVIGFFIASYYLEFSAESQSFIDNINKSLITILIFWLMHQFIQPVTYLLGGLEKLLYLSSEFISKDLDKDLINAGYSVDRISNYTSMPVEEIDKKTLDFFEKKPPDVIFIYSSMSAKKFI